MLPGTTEEFSDKPLKKLWLLIRKVAGVITSGVEDASSRELGILPEDMLIDDEIQNQNSHSANADEDQPEG